MSGRITQRSVGLFDPRLWISEGDGLLESAKFIRDGWGDHRKIFSATISERKQGKRNAGEDWSKLEGLPRASVLLVSYASEMYLKAGLAKIYIGCAEDMFDRDVRKFGHNLKKLASETDFPKQRGDANNLQEMKQSVLFDARYPVEATPETFVDKTNNRTGRIWNDSRFKKFVDLSERLKLHASSIDRDSSDAAHHFACNIDDDGYLAFRYGGRVRPRITFRTSSMQKENGFSGITDIKAIFPKSDYWELHHHWNAARIVEDGIDKDGKLLTVIHT